jgi:hypothetical protein
VYAALGAAVGAFVLTTPAAIFDLSHLVAGIRTEVTHYSTGHPGAEGNSLSYYVHRLALQEGPVLLFAPLAALAGRRMRAALVPAVFVVGYFLFLIRYPVHFERNLLPLLAPLLVLAAMGMVESFTLLRKVGARVRLQPVVASVAGIAVAAALVGIQLRHSVIDAARLAHDERAAAQQWIAAHLPAGSRIAMEAWSPWVDPAKYKVLGELQLSDVPIDWYRQKHVDYVVATERMFGQFMTGRYPAIAQAYDKIFATFPTVAVFNQDHPIYPNTRQSEVDFWDGRIYVLKVSP